MTDPALRARLERKIAEDIRHNIIGAALGGLPGLFVTFITYGMFYLLVTLAFPRNPWAQLVIPAVVLVLLFVGNATLSVDYLGDWSFTTGTASNKVVRLGQFGEFSNINPLAPDSMHSFLKMVLAVLFTGPALFTTAFGMLRKAMRLRSIDREACASVVSLLLSRDSMVPCRDIIAQIPGLHPARVFRQLKDIDGVYFIEAQRAGFVLSPDLRRELSAPTQ